MTRPMMARYAFGMSVGGATGVAISFLGLPFWVTLPVVIVLVVPPVIWSYR